MASRILSQIFNQNSQSLYETFRQDEENDEDSDLDDIEERAGLLPADAAGSTDMEESTFELQQQQPMPGNSSFLNPNSRTSYVADMSRSRGSRFVPARFRDEEPEEVDEVPQSLLFEAGAAPVIAEPSGAPRPSNKGGLGTETGGGDPGPNTAAARERRLHDQWTAATAQAQEREKKYQSEETRARARLGLIDPKERALWKWANVENLDNFLNDVYDYFLGKGIYSITLNRLLHLLTLAFVVAFTTFLSLCIDYPKIRSSKRFAEVVNPHCMADMSGMATFFLWILSFYWVIKAIHYLLDTRRLWDLHNFYLYLLNIPDSDMQTISWQEVVARLMVLRDSNPITSNALLRRHYNHQSKQRMDAHDIANRLMRKDNYLIALFNKDVLDLTVPLPLLRNRGGMLTKTLEWNLSWCILDFAFNEQGQLRPMFLKESHRRVLSDGLRRRFFYAATMNIIFAPFIVTYFLLLFLLKNLHDFIKMPARIGHRQYTPLAEWKFREFNELYHLFQLRLNMSYPAAEAYVDQFPRDKTAQLARFVSFVASSLLGVLAIGTLIDSELITQMEITPGLNSLFYITVLSTIVAVSRGMLPEEYTVYDPEWAIGNVIQHIHYMPDQWKGKLHSDEIKRDFMKLYDMKVMIFLQEVLSVIFTPFVLWFSLPNSCDRIVDFFREFTVHVDGIGYHKASDPRDEYFGAKDNKMMASVYGFLDQYHVQPNSKSPNKRRPYLSPNLTTDNRLRSRRPDGRMQMQQSFHRDSSIIRGGSGLETLLDTHHQPPPGFAAAGKRGFMAEGLREEDEDLRAGGTGGGTAPGVGMRDDEQGIRYRSNLGESFMSTRFTGDPEEPKDRGKKKEAGVLHLLEQFVGAQGEGGRAGVL
ncbi:autophagy protein atg9 [Rhizina undulata]